MKAQKRASKIKTINTYSLGKPRISNCSKRIRSTICSIVNILHTTHLKLFIQLYYYLSIYQNILQLRKREIIHESSIYFYYYWGRSMGYDRMVCEDRKSTRLNSSHVAISYA